MSKANSIRRTNEPGTCPWCGTKLPQWTHMSVVKEVRNPDYEKQMRAWEQEIEEARGTLKEKHLRRNEPPSILRQLEKQKVPAINRYAPFCRLRCAEAFAHAAHKNGFRLKPYTGPE